MTEHKSFDGRKVRIPASTRNRISPCAGQIGTIAWAGWADQYCVFVDGKYYVRASAAELEPNLVKE